MSARQKIHELVDRLPEKEVPAARRFLEYLCADPVWRKVASAPTDDEPLLEEERAAIQEALTDKSKTIPHEEIVREFGK